MDVKMDLYLLYVNDEVFYPSCPECGEDMSYFASPAEILLKDKNHHEVRDDAANKFLNNLREQSGGEWKRKKVSADKQFVISDFYPG